MAPGGSLRWVGRLDMYRKVPAELLEGSRRGSLLSYLAVAALLGLFLFESGAYFRRRPVTDLTLDANKEARIRVNFNITMMDLKCDYTVIDVVSVLGVEQNISSFTSKWSVDAAGVRRRYQGRNREQRDIRLYDPAVGRELDAADDLYKNGESAISLDAETLQYALNEQEYVQGPEIDAMTSGCSQVHSRPLLAGTSLLTSTRAGARTAATWGRPGRRWHKSCRTWPRTLSAPRGTSTTTSSSRTPRRLSSPS